MKTKIDFLKQELKELKSEKKEFGQSACYGRNISRATRMISKAKRNGVGQSCRMFIGEE